MNKIIRCGGDTGEGCGTILTEIDQACPNCLPDFYDGPDATPDPWQPLRDAGYTELELRAAAGDK